MDRASRKEEPVTSTLLQGSGELLGSVASVVSSAYPRVQVSKITMRASSSLHGTLG